MFAGSADARGAVENSPDKLNLRECIRISLANSTEIKIGEKSENYARKEIDDHRAAYWPNIFLTAETFVSREMNGSCPVAVNARWDLFNRGKRFFERNKAEECYLASQWQRKLIVQEMVCRTAAAYILRMQYQEEYKILAEGLAQEEKRLETVMARSEEGIVPELDVVNVEAQICKTKIELSKAFSKIKKYRFLLNNAMGLDINKTVEIEGINYFYWDALMDEYSDIKKCLEEAFLCRPDYKIAGYNLEADREDLNIARAETRPLLFLKTGYYLHTPSGGDNDLNVNVVLDVPLFEGGRKKARIEKANIQVEIAMLEKKALEEKIYKNITYIHEEMINLKQELCFREERRNLLLKNLEAQKSLYNAGMNDIDKLNDAHQDYMTSRLELNRVKIDMLSKFLAFLLETGEIDIIALNHVTPALIAQ